MCFSKLHPLATHLFCTNTPCCLFAFQLTRGGKIHCTMDENGQMRQELGRFAYRLTVDMNLETSRGCAAFPKHNVHQSTDPFSTLH